MNPRNTRVGMVLAAAVLLTTAAPAAASTTVGAEPVGAQALAICKPHHLNTAFWASCKSGSTPSKVRVAGKCKQLIGGPVWRWTKWKPVPRGNSKPVSGECTLKVLGSKVEVKKL